MSPAGIAPSAAALFGPAWAERLERELRASEPFRTASAGWKGSLVFVLEDERGGPPESAVFVDLAHGGAVSVRPALARDLGVATFRVDGPAEAWEKLLRGEIEPPQALAAGQVKLVRGSFFSLLPRLAAAKELFRAAQRVPTDFGAR